MALNGAAWASVADRFSAYVEGAVPLTLVPFGGGTPVPFAFQAPDKGLEFTPTEPGALSTETLRVKVRQGLADASQWTYNGHRWTVTRVEPDALGGASLPWRITLERHAG